MSRCLTVPTALLGAVGHYKRGNVDLKTGLIYAAAGVAGALLWAFVSDSTPPVLLRRVFGCYAVVLALLMLLTGGKGAGASGRGQERSFRRTAARAAIGSFFGLVSGAIAGLFGTSGAAPVVAGLYIMRLPARIVVGTCILVVFCNSLSGLFGHLMLGKFDPRLVLLLGSGFVLSAMVMVVGLVMIFK